MKKLFFSLGLVLIVLLLLVKPVKGNNSYCSGDVPEETLVDVTRTITDNPDSGENGNDWAIDTFSQRIRIWQGGENYFCAQTEDTGNFTAIAGEESPGIDEPVILTGNEEGTFEGGARYYIGGIFDPEWQTSGDLGTFEGTGGYSSFLTNYFDNLGYDFIDWGWHYKSCGHGVWDNTSTGNAGDIVPEDTGEVCGEPVVSNNNTGGSSPGIWQPEEYKPAVCTVALPNKAKIVSAVHKSPTEVEVIWESSDTNLTHFALTYGYTETNLSMGVPYLPKEARSFTIGQLPVNAKVYVEVWSFNGGACAVYSGRFLSH